MNGLAAICLVPNSKCTAYSVAAMICPTTAPSALTLTELEILLPKLPVSVAGGCPAEDA